MKFSERFAEAMFFLVAAAIIAAVCAICFFLFKEGFPAISEIGAKNFVFGKSWRPSENRYGMLPMIMGSICVTVLAAAMAIPIGVLTAVFTAKLCSDWLYGIIKTAIGILAAIPSVVYGLFGLTTVAPAVRRTFGGDGASMLAAAIVLAIMILPTIVAGVEAALSSAVQEHYLGALALGADKVRSVYFVLLPSAKNSIASAAALGIARAVGETTAVMMISGNQAVMPKGLLKGIRTVTANIALEIGYAAELHRAALTAAALLLFIAVMAINIAVLALRRKKR